jgi:hypothetical protein
MSTTPHSESHNQVLTAITSVTRGRDVLAALAAAWSVSAGQLGMRETDETTQAARPCEPTGPSSRVTREVNAASQM